MDKIQVGEDVWIKPNRGCEVPEYGAYYFLVNKFAEAQKAQWTNHASDYAFLQIGNFFPTREAAEQAIIKPADPTPITREQWVEAGKPVVWALGGTGHTIVPHPLACATTSFWFAANKRWLTRESAQAWLDKWNAEHGVKA